MNLRLFFLLVILESIGIVCGVFGIIFLFFFNFGSGAGATSQKAILTQNLALMVLASLPLFFGIFKYRSSIGKGKAESYLYSGLLVTIVSGICFGLLI
ncbi:MAG: hypothetical protein V4548_05775 [Bacteroidota bacterium]